MVLQEDGMGKEMCWQNTSQNPFHNRGNSGEVFECRGWVVWKDLEGDVLIVDVGWGKGGEDGEQIEGVLESGDVVMIWEVDRWAWK